MCCFYVLGLKSFENVNISKSLAFLIFQMRFKFMAVRSLPMHQRSQRWVLFSLWDFQQIHLKFIMAVSKIVDFYDYMKFAMLSSLSCDLPGSAGIVKCPLDAQFRK